MRRRLLLVLGLALAVAAGTWVVGWWAVIPLAALAGWWQRGHAGDAALAGALGWTLLLAAAATGDHFTALSDRMAGVLHLPAPGLWALTVALPAVLGWSAAALAGALNGGWARDARRPGP